MIWFLVPWLGLAGGTVITAVIFRFGNIRNYSALPRNGFAALAGTLASALVAAVLAMAAGCPFWAAAGAVVTAASASFLFLCTVFLSRGSIRVKMLRELRDHPRTQVADLQRQLDQLADVGSAEDDTVFRIERLIASGYLVERDEHLIAPASPALLYARMIGVLRWAFGAR